MMGTSIGVTHGTATKKNAIGKAKWRIHGFPPADQIYKSVKVATEAVWIQPSGRHSGVPISKRRIGKRRRSAETPINAATVRLLRIWDLRFEISGGGRSCQRSQKRYRAKKGTNHP